MELIPVVDGHNDLAWALREYGYDLLAHELDRDRPEFHTDVPRLRAGGVRAQFWSVWVPGTLAGDRAVAATLEQIDAVGAFIDRYPAHFARVTDADDFDRLVAAGPHAPIASLMGAEGGHSIANSLGVLRILHRLGVRYLTLTHNENNDWADSATDEPRHHGLTAFGTEVIREMNRLGMIVDLSHTSVDTMADALAVSTAPVIFSHSSARAICPHPRNVPDDILADLTAQGGLCMATFVAPFVSAAAYEWRSRAEDEARHEGIDVHDHEQMEAFYETYPIAMPPATLEDVVAHFEHLREVVGIDHLGVGADFDGTSWLPEGLSDVSCYPRLWEALARGGWSHDDLTKVGWRNMSRVLHMVEDRAGTMQATERVPADESAAMRPA
ncbi:dipeptidase [Raineyella sp.]|uniref:dipeptidase n=1 Tax=Raineyella sp. TaxID=1911550 RepID=UPI002B1EB871|nr:dipeptidase [Raineyella sp.]MEA5155569.1 dipeptidase [Raineyella sp.]